MSKIKNLISCFLCVFYAISTVFRVKVVGGGGVFLSKIKFLISCFVRVNLLFILFNLRKVEKNTYIRYTIKYIIIIHTIVQIKYGYRYGGGGRFYHIINFTPLSLELAWPSLA